MAGAGRLQSEIPEESLVVFPKYKSNHPTNQPTNQPPTACLGAGRLRQTIPVFLNAHGISMPSLGIKTYRLTAKIILADWNQDVAIFTVKYV